MRPKLSEAEQPNAVIYSGELHKHHSVPSPVPLPQSAGTSNHAN